MQINGSPVIGGGSIQGAATGVTNVVNVVSGGSPVIDLEAISGGTNAMNYGPTSTLYTGTIAHFSDGSVIQLPFAAGLNDPLALNDLLR